MVRVAGHFGEWVQGRTGPDGLLVLVTVACPAFHAEAHLVEAGPFHLTQDPQVLDPDRAKQFLTDLERPLGHYSLRVTMPPGGGAGASTAALVALARAAAGTQGDLAPACLAFEGAVDPLMLRHPDRALWAPRQAFELRRLPPHPEAEVVGGFWGPPQRTDPEDQTFPDISDLLAEMGQLRGLDHLAQIASASSQRSGNLRAPGLADPTADLAQSLGALGHLRAHTGSARGLIFAPGTAPAGAEDALAEAGLTQITRFRTGGAR